MYNVLILIFCVFFLFNKKLDFFYKTKLASHWSLLLETNKQYWLCNTTHESIKDLKYVNSYFNFFFYKKEYTYSKLKYSRTPQNDISSGGAALFLTSFCGILFLEKFGFEMVDNLDFFVFFFYSIFFIYFFKLVSYSIFFLYIFIDIKVLLTDIFFLNISSKAVNGLV